ncbi:MAG: hypothetical protein KGL95_09075 [Patescibacteria group bacterium]|nr:hypothetical protein [Patescibacteria group bacterium]
MLLEEDSLKVAKEVANNLQSMGIVLKGFTKSPLIGGKGGNSEYLAYFENYGE